MKQTYIFCLFFLSLFSSAQIINFPDANFKAKLLAASSSNFIAKDLSGNNFKIDANNNNEIEQSEAIQVKELRVNSSNIASLVGISNFTNLTYLDCNSNQIINLSFTSLNLLQNINCSGNQLTSLNISNLLNLNSLNCGYNLITSLNLTNLNVLNSLEANNNQLTQLDLSNINSNLSMLLYLANNNLQSLDISEIKVNSMNFNISQNPNLTYLNIKDGQNFTNHYGYINSQSLTYICADEGEISSINDYLENFNPQITTCQVNSYCTFVPGGTFYTIQGQQKYDNENNGCDIADLNIPYQKYTITNGTTTGSIVSNNSGNYSIPVQAGSHTIAPSFEFPNYFTVSPTNVVVNFPTQSSPFTQDFCITSNGNHHNVEVSIIPINVARPGFDCNYEIIYKNKGNQIENGTINFQFNDAILDVVSTSTSPTQTLNNLSFNYSNLQPFETKGISVILNLNSPTETPAVNSGNILNYTATITQSGIDEVLSDNTFTLNQTVVNSYDPNDKTCLQGNYVGPDKIGQYVHYIIRFENTGTFPAENIVVKDMINISRFDVSSLIPLNASHNYVTRINDNKVEFIFENINLPFDDANNDGYVAFKIKTLPTLAIGNVFSNSANIYFDYNFPIVTNTTTTTIVALSNPSFEFANYFSLYPNPSTNELNINLKSAIEINSIQIYNTIGQLVTVQTGNALKVDVSNLKTGNYFIKINTNEGYSTSQFIKE